MTTDTFTVNYDGLSSNGYIVADQRDRDIGILTAERDALKARIAMREQLYEHLVLWANSGLSAPKNELESIASWLAFSNSHTLEEMQDVMRKRMILLQRAALDLANEGPEAEAEAGIYNNRQRVDFEPGPAPGLYRHQDGGYYEVIGRARDSKDGSTVVLYEHKWPFEAGTWTRPIGEWESRFKPVTADELTQAQMQPRAEAQARVTSAKQARKKNTNEAL